MLKPGKQHSTINSSSKPVSLLGKFYEEYNALDDASDDTRDENLDETMYDIDDSLNSMQEKSSTESTIVDATSSSSFAHQYINYQGHAVITEVRTIPYLYSINIVPHIQKIITYELLTHVSLLPKLCLSIYPSLCSRLST